MSIAAGILHSRYLFSKSDFRSSDNTVWGSAFMPNEGETSVFSIQGLGDAAIWSIGVDHVEAERKRNGSPNSLKARADFDSAVPVAQALDIVAETSLHPLHANIIGWPEDASAQAMKATNIAEKSSLKLRPKPQP